LKQYDQKNQDTYLDTYRGNGVLQFYTRRICWFDTWRTGGRFARGRKWSVI